MVLERISLEYAKEHPRSVFVFQPVNTGAGVKPRVTSGTPGKVFKMI